MNNKYDPQQIDITNVTEGKQLLEGDLEKNINALLAPIGVNLNPMDKRHVCYETDGRVFSGNALAEQSPVFDPDNGTYIWPDISGNFYFLYLKNGVMVLLREKKKDKKLGIGCYSIDYYAKHAERIKHLGGEKNYHNNHAEKLSSLSRKAKQFSYVRQWLALGLDYYESNKQIFAVKPHFPAAAIAAR